MEVYKLLPTSYTLWYWKQNGGAILLKNFRQLAPQSFLTSSPHRGHANLYKLINQLETMELKKDWPTAKFVPQKTTSYKLKKTPRYHSFFTFWPHPQYANFHGPSDQLENVYKDCWDGSETDFLFTDIALFPCHRNHGSDEDRSRSILEWKVADVVTE